MPVIWNIADMITGEIIMESDTKAQAHIWRQGIKTAGKAMKVTEETVVGDMNEMVKVIEIKHPS